MLNEGMMDILKLQACSEQNSREVVEKLGGTVSVLRQKRAQTPEDCCYGAKTEIGCGTTGWISYRQGRINKKRRLVFSAEENET